jgi:predicted metalloprotease with PDZ domain
MTAIRIVQLSVALTLAAPNLAYSPIQTSSRAPAVSYVVTIPKPHTHVFSVEMRIDGATADTLDVSMPVWTPGSYLVREYERHVVSFAARDAAGKPLAWRKLDKNTWRVATGRMPGIAIEYDVYAREPGIRWSFVSDLGGHVLGPNLFMYVVGATDQPTSAKLDLPAGWRLAGGIAPDGGNPYEISARSYHELIDTPMLIGDFASTTFEVDGTPHVIAILGPNNADLDRLREEFARIVGVCAEMFGGLPYDRYAFVFTTLTGGGGIEHANGTTIGLGQLDFSDPGAHRAVLGVTAHEFFHAWNVKRIRPPAFKPYDYEMENYTDALWFYEGFTSYYGDRILYRAGLIDSLSDPTDMVVRYRSTPGNYNQSAAAASFNAWIHLYRSDESTDNYRTDYYFKGSVIANLLDLEIANRTGGASGIDDVMRLMWQRTRDQGAAFDSEAIRRVCEEVAGGSFVDFFARYIYGTEKIPFEDFFALAGYRLVVDEEATRERDRNGFLGVGTQLVDDHLRVTEIVRGSPAWEYGLNYGDEILAIDGNPIVSYQSFLDALHRLGPGETAQIQVSRYGQELTLSVTLGVRAWPLYRLDEADTPSETQLAVRRRWRG